MAKKAVRKSAPAKRRNKAKKPTARRRPAPPPAPAPVTREMIAKRAYEIWMRKNRLAQSNHPAQNWLEAEIELGVRSGK